MANLNRRIHSILTEYINMTIHKYHGNMWLRYCMILPIIIVIMVRMVKSATGLALIVFNAAITLEFYLV